MIITATDSDTDTLAGLGFVLGLAALVALIIVVVLWQGASIYRARTAAARESAYQSLAARAVTAQEELVAGQQRTAATLDELRNRMTKLENILQAVE